MIDDHDVVNWNVSKVKELQERLKAVGMPQFVFDEEERMLYKDEIHKLLGIGIKVKEG